MSSQQPSPDAPTAMRSPEETPTVVVTERERRALQLTPGTIVGDRYRIVSLIGRGGMGEIYRADDLKLAQIVALKVVSHREHAALLYEEVRIGRQISHPNVCRVYDIGEENGDLFITMEFVDGEDLASLLRRVGRLSPEKALAVCRDICAGVAAAHEKGVIHRDLKPANVMIDGRGRARVTDFGLAVAGDRATDSAGTPAYMAPEQLAGESASVRSDIYALGLVLYEVFTGRRTFESTSSHDLLMRQRAADFTRPSLVAREVPSAVERVIVRCLDPSPESRPSSVEEIMRELPGGDALAAAIAAGETPSPAMVAAAAKSGELSPYLAWIFLAFAIAGIMIGSKIGEQTLLYRLSEVKAPEVLEERAHQILAAAKLTERPADSDIAIHREPRPTRLVALYRQSRSAMRPYNADGTLEADDPPLSSGMANVTLDGAGDLIRFTIVPPVVENPPAHSDVNWEPFISAAGYESRTLAPTTPQLAASVDSDNKLAWFTKDGNRIEAASYHGRPVSFSVRDRRPLRSEAAATTSSLADRLGFIMFVAFLISIPVAAIVLARSNLRRRQGDRIGAMRFASFYFVCAFVSLVAHAHHSMTFVNEWIITSWHVAQATFWALIAGLMYIALEPLVRRRWPEMLISWTRLLNGRFTDPMVGRDVLTGAAAATIAVIWWHIVSLISAATPLSPQQALGPARHIVFWIFETLGEAAFRGVGMIVLLLIVRAVIPNDIMASLTTALLIAILGLRDTTGPLEYRAIYGVIAAWIGVILARQFGMLAVMSYAFFVLIQQRVPLTLDASAWYFARSAFVMAILAVIAIYAFRISVGVKRWLPRFAFDT